MFDKINIRNIEIPKPIFAAPLAGITDKPYREILRALAPDVPILTEMISCHSITHRHKNDKSTGNRRNWDEYADEGLIGAQIFGTEPNIMADAAKILEQNGASWIDINMGCPVPKVAQKAGAGAGLMRTPKLAGEIVDAVVRAVKIPVTMKTRLGWDANSLNGAEIVKICADNGACLCTIHGRTRAQGYAGRANWDEIAKLKSAIRNQKSKIPVIFNGDIHAEQDMQFVKDLGADGVMLARALLGNPWILAELSGNEHEPRTRATIILEHLHKTLDYYGARAGVPLFRKHAAWYATGMQGNAEFRTKVNQTVCPVELEKIIKDFFA